MPQNTKKDITVYAHWQGMEEPLLMGLLSASPAKGKESFSFEYSNSWLQSGFSQTIDPDLQLYTGAFYPKEDKPNFGVFLDSCPDRWGRVLMQRREAIIARGEKRPPKKLLESDFLLGVYDGHRMGALRFKIEEGPFLNDNREMATPPWTSLRELEQASFKFEEDNTDDPEYLKWLNILIAPGSSLGGARPKASIIDTENNLWIAKFPSKNDDKDIAAWEMVANQLAIASGIHVAEGKLQRFNNKYHTYLTKRFDRTQYSERIHFASAMTLLGHVDGEGGGAGVSYLEMVEFISRSGATVEKDLEELWRRIVLNICIKNTDDHLRNHGFLLTDAGWVLSPAYDINPNEYGTELSLNITDVDNSLNLELALEVADYFRLSNKKANDIISQISKAVRNWKKIAATYKIAKAEQERMASAFE